MNPKLKNILTTAWNEPRHFFFWLTLLGVTGLVLAIFITSWLSQPVGALQFIALGCLVCVPFGFLAFILAWIPLVRRLFAWLLQRRFLFLAGIVTLIALGYAVENWRGKRAWERYKQVCEAKGESLEASAFIPPPVPDEQNFAMNPLLAPLFDFKPKTQQWRDTNALRRVKEISPHYNAASAVPGTREATRHNSWGAASQTDLLTWYGAFLKTNTNGDHTVSSAISTNVSRREAALQILAALGEANSALDELRAASRRPSARFNIRYENDNPAVILIPHLGVCKKVCEILKLRASAELAIGRSEAAFNDINLMLRLAEAIREEPVLISYLVCVTELQLAFQPIFEGLAAHQWTEQQLEALQQRLQNFDFISSGPRALAAERVLSGGGVIDFLRRDPNNNKYRAFISPAPPGFEKDQLRLQGMLVAVAPSGWFYLEKLNYNRLFDDFLVPLIDVGNRQISPELCRKADAELDEKLNDPKIILFLRHRMFSAFLLPALTNVAQKTARAQTGVDLTVLAIALERYRLAHGQYPETLDALVPQFMSKLPHDVINGQPLKYRRTDDPPSPGAGAAGGSFILYSVGWNEKDDGGTVAFNQDGKGVNSKEGDWVWRYPAN